MLEISSRLPLGAALVLLIPLSVPASAQLVDELTQAKTLYTQASYEDALKVLGESDGVEAHHYRALCFLALGKLREAQDSLEALVTLSPEHVFSDDDSPPRLVSLFAQTKRRMLPAILRQMFTEARGNFQARDNDQAQKKFKRVLALTNDPAVTDDPDLTDLQLLTTSYLDILEKSATSTSAPSSTIARSPGPTQPSAVSNAPALPATSAGASTAGVAASSPDPPVTTRATIVVPASTIRQTIPAYTPAVGMEGKTLTGAVRIVIGVDGKVKNATMEQSVAPGYDIRLLAAAKSWSYKPATLNGAPVESEKLVSITVGAP